MNRKFVIGLIVAASSLGLGTTEANACLFARCRVHHKRQVVCPPQAYAYALPSPQAAPAPQAPSTSGSDINTVIDAVINGNAFNGTVNGQARRLQIQRLQIVPAQ